MKRLKMYGAAVTVAALTATGSAQVSKTLPGKVELGSVTVEAIEKATRDAKAPSITFSGPNGWSYSTRVEDTKALAKVKVGDKVDITWTGALIVSLDDAK
jgi:hypothetical protein